MAFNRKRPVLVGACLTILLLLALFTFSRKPVQLSNPVTVSLLGYTNGGSLRFALLAFSNQASYSIWCRDTWSEVEGVPEHKARIMNRTLPFRIEPELKGHHSFIVAVGEPTPNETGSWRFNMAYSPYLLRDRWWFFSLSHPSAAKIGRVLHLDRPSPLSPSNQVTVSSVWLTNATSF